MALTTETNPVTSTPLRGALYMLGAVAAFSCMDVTMKLLGESYPASEVTLLRGAAAMPILLAASALFGRMRELRPRRWSLHLLRGLLSFVTLYFFVWSIARLALSHAYAIFMSAPLLIVILAGPILGEPVSLRRWLAVGTGMLGVLWALQPSAAGFSVPGGLAALTAAFGYALTVILIRVQVRTETGAATVFWALLFQTLISAAVMFDAFVPFRWQDWPLVLGLGVSGALGQHLITQAFRMAPAQLLAPLEYTALLWGVAFDALLWKTFPNLHVLLGAALVVASGSYVVANARNA